MMEQIAKILREQGLNPVDEGGFLTFSYQNINFLYLEDERDGNFYSMYIPGILKVEEAGQCNILEVLNSINNQLKFVKFVLNGEYVWVGMEQKCYSEPNMKEMVTFSIEVLLFAYHSFQEKWGRQKDLN